MSPETSKPRSCPRSHSRSASSRSTRRCIILREALRPSLFSLVTVAGLSFGQLLGGSVIVESLFNLPGLGNLLVTSIQAKDFPVVQAGVLIIAVVFVAINTLVDISYTILEPRVRRAHA
jgi:peptide/nickel transport system permease protein